MGLNSVAFLLNDFFSDIERSPKTVAYLLTHPPQTESEKERLKWGEEIDGYADSIGEKRLHPQAVEMLCTFHADGTKFYMAGGNCIHEFGSEDVKYYRHKGENFVKLKLPEWKNR